MKRTIALALLGTTLALPAQAMEWPWQSQQDTRYGFCKGFVMAGLASDQMSNTSRTNLWLTWNYINRAELPKGSISETDFAEGREQFNSLIASGNHQSIRDISDSECYLGRRRHSRDETVAEA